MEKEILAKAKQEKRNYLGKISLKMVKL